MSSEEDRLKHSARRKRNVVAKHMIENKGAFALKVIDPRKEEYKRKHMRVTEVLIDEED